MLLLYRAMVNNVGCGYIRLDYRLRKVTRGVVVSLRVVRVSWSAVIARVLTCYWHGILLSEHHGQILEQCGLPLNLILGHGVALSLPMGMNCFLIHHNFFLRGFQLKLVAFIMTCRDSAHDCILWGGALRI